jgi:hypothetical protein
MKLATNPHDGESADFEVQIGSAMVSGNSQEIVNLQGHAKT